MVRSTKNENEVVTVMIAAKRPQKGEISLRYASLDNSYPTKSSTLLCNK